MSDAQPSFESTKQLGDVSEGGGELSGPTRVVEVIAPSRLHFGLLAFDAPSGPQYGGVGAMIGTPGVRLMVKAAPRWQVTGPLAARAEQVARMALSGWDVTEPGCRIEIVSVPRAHVGLGTGTQLALSVVAGLQEFLGHAPLSPEQMAEVAGRAQRSSVGCHGFAHGGLLFDGGKGPTRRLGALRERVEIPAAWRWLLVCPPRDHGLSGEAERAAFGGLAPIPRTVTERLTEEAQQHLLPAARRGDVSAMGESLYRYGVTAGNCFAAEQHGPFATEQLATLVEILRGFGIRGVGQSSWGPTLFGLCESQEDAEHYARAFSAHPAARGVSINIVAPNNRGATISTTVHSA